MPSIPRVCASTVKSALFRSLADQASFTSFNAIHVAELSFTGGLVLSRSLPLLLSLIELSGLRTLSLADGEFKSVGAIDFQSG